MSTVEAFLNRYPALTYFALTFTISWGGVLIVVGPGGIPGTPEQFKALLPLAILAMVAGPSAAGLLLTGLVYGSVFTLNHLWFAHLVVAARHPIVSAFQFVLSVVLALVYVKTRSLRWPVAAHFLANLLSPTVAMLLNLYVP